MRTKNSFVSYVSYLVFLCTLLFYNLVHAQANEESINLQGYEFSDSYRYSILEDSGLLRFPGPFVITTSGAYVNTPLVVSDENSDSKVTDYLNNFWIMTFGGAWYASDIFSFGGSLNYISTTYSDSQPTGYGYENNRGDTIAGLGDSSLYAKIRLFRDIEKKVGISFIPKIEFSTGDPESFSTDESERISGLIVLEKLWDRFGILLSSGYSTSSSAVYQQIDYRQMLPINIGLSWKLNSAWNINVESSRSIALNGGDKQDVGDYYLTLKGKAFKYASFYTGFGIAGANDVDQDNWTIFAGLKFFGENRKQEPAEPTQEVAFVEPAPTLIPVEPPPAVIVKRDQEKLLGALLVTDRVYFDNGLSKVQANESKKLDKVVDSFISHEKDLTKVIIEGYASKVGPRKLNQRLSKERAQNVLNYLKRKGVNSKLLQIVYYGDDYLNEEPEHWMNRRVEFRVYSKNR